jgi:lysophospholipid hydrolase
VVGQADRLLIVARASNSPALSDIETVIKESAHDTRTDLVLLHEPDVKIPSGTGSWLKPRSIRNHYHIRSGDNAHLGRMARRMSGHAIALVMGGGSAKGYAEMGFYKAMLETGIPFDYVGGASMGAIMGGQMALESDYEAFEQNAQWTADIGVIDRTLPLVAMAASNNVKKINQHCCGETLIEDLWCPFFCVSTSLSTASLKVHQSGSMWRAIRASMSIPGVFVPVVEDGDVLVDGGIMDNFPVALMQSLAESNRIIGVDVVPYRERLKHYDIDTSISGWRVLFNRLNPFSKKMKTPTLVEILIRTLEVNATKSSRDQAALTDLLIQPDTRGFGPTAYDKWKPLAQRGYEASIEPLKAWKLKQGLK